MTPCRKKTLDFYRCNQQSCTPSDSQLGDVPFQGAPIALPLHVAVGARFVWKTPGAVGPNIFERWRLIVEVDEANQHLAKR